jgi:hypothetical protein
MSTTKDLGFLSLGAFRFESGSMTPNGTTQTDIYKFTTGSVVATVSIGSFPSSPSQSPFALALFKDSNKSGVLDNGDAFVPPVSDSGSGDREASEFISHKLPQGTYFARAQSFAFDNVNYGISFVRASSGSANPLAASEIPLGTIAQDLRRVDRVSDADTADNFAFTLDGSSSLNIGVKELGNKKGDVNIRVVQDLNANGVVDKNEVVVKGISTGDTDTITGLKGAGDYILQVCQSKGSTRFEVNFDHSAA